MLRRSLAGALLLAVVVLVSGRFVRGAEESASTPKWAMNATIIEACSCPMFCQCYFDTKPAAHSMGEGHAMKGHDMKDMAEHYCKFNNAYKINKGNWGDTQLDGVKFWASGDLGGDFSEGNTEWIQVTFEPSATKEQRDAVKQILGHVYPVKWKQFIDGPDKSIEWTADTDKAVAKLDGGKAAEVVLKKNQGMTEQPIVIKNMRYFGAPRNDGFMLMQNEVEALRQAPEGKEPYEFKGTNGFMITFDINSDDAMKQQQAKAEK